MSYNKNMSNLGRPTKTSMAGGNSTHTVTPASKAKSTHQEILTKAIEKAIAGGWKLESEYVSDGYLRRTEPRFMIVSEAMPFYADDYYWLIFNRGFAKSLWPEVPYYELACPKCDGRYNLWDKERAKEWGPSPKYCNADGARLKKVTKGTTSPWWYHLRQMVIAEDPIAYLGEHI